MTASGTIALRLQKAPSYEMQGDSPRWSALAEFPQEVRGETQWHPLKVEAYGRAAEQVHQLYLVPSAEFVASGRFKTQEVELEGGGKKVYWILVISRAMFLGMPKGSPASLAVKPTPSLAIAGDPGGLDQKPTSGDPVPVATKTLVAAPAASSSPESYDDIPF